MWICLKLSFLHICAGFTRKQENLHRDVSLYLKEQKHVPVCVADGNTQNAQTASCLSADYKCGSLRKPLSEGSRCLLVPLGPVTCCEM